MTLSTAPALSPANGRWQIMIIEDADRLGNGEGRTGNTLLKAIEEPSPSTIWLLCAPTVEDVLPTIRSRCRNIALTTPSAVEVAEFLSDAGTGSIPRCRGLRRPGEPGPYRPGTGAGEATRTTRNRRREVVAIPARLTSLGACMNAAENLVDIAKVETEAITAATNEAASSEDCPMSSAATARPSRRVPTRLPSQLDHSLKQRGKRRILDVVDRCLMDLVSVYRDVIAVQTGAPGDLVNEEMRGDISGLARRSTPEQNLRRIDAVFAAREKMLEFQVPPLLALESMMLSLRL